MAHCFFLLPGEWCFQSGHMTPLSNPEVADEPVRYVDLGTLVRLHMWYTGLADFN